MYTKFLFNTVMENMFHYFEDENHDEVDQDIAEL